MKWVNIGVDSQEDRLRIAGILCENGYKVYCKSVKSPYRLSAEHYVCVLLSEAEMTDDEED